MALHKKTVDMLDAHLSAEHVTFISADEYKRSRFFTEELRLDPVNWATYHGRFTSTLTTNGLTVTWNEFKYSDVIANRNLIDTQITSTETGVYMFIVQSNDDIYNFSRFVLYVGISGENNSNRPLKDRLKDYFRLEQVKKRDAVLRIIEKYKNNVRIAYFLANTTTAVLKEIEQALIGFFYPLANKDDFPVELQPSKKSF